MWQLGPTWNSSKLPSWEDLELVQPLVKRDSSNHLLTLKLLQTCTSFFLMLNTKESIFKNVGTNQTVDGRHWLPKEKKNTMEAMLPVWLTTTWMSKRWQNYFYFSVNYSFKTSFIILLTLFCVFCVHLFTQRPPWQTPVILRNKYILRLL